ncbi:hypothetical protein OZX72_08220 [Bifidobacterium sp. ESL0769]|uniref:hypothetical protein n=1 Tax=Bifidobacterium sp. ESL0769 TaxID=2983229 RepID=UPI0023F82738|nr:hypothetical protein [Bifidobacterium sp. ESL0769]WEV67209.1 hypothetical protein OZX72_08220 [Bifidobacterium sp. ESL0769]
MFVWVVGLGWRPTRVLANNPQDVLHTQAGELYTLLIEVQPWLGVLHWRPALHQCTGENEDRS